MWPREPSHNPNAIPLHTYKPETGYWREGRQWSYTSTKIGGHQLDNLRLVGKEYHGQHIDLWESHPRRRFGGLPVSFWMGLEEAQGGQDENKSLDGYSHHGSSTGNGTINSTRSMKYGNSPVDSEEFAMYRRYLASVYGHRYPTPQHAATPNEPTHPMTEAERIWTMYKEERNARVKRHAMAAGGAMAAASGLYKYLNNTSHDAAEAGEVDLEVDGLESALLGKFGKGLTTLESWKARIEQTPRWSQLRRYEFHGSLGKGAHAETFLVMKGDRKYVLKESELLQEAVNEARLLTQISSPHVVKLEDFFIETLGHRNIAYLQLEYCDGGDLGTLLNGSVRLDDTAIRNILAQISEGLVALHEKLIVHRDLKPDNILLTKQRCVKISDLGISTRLSASLPNTTYAAGSVPFMAPEVRRFLLGEDVVYNEKADVWAVGTLAYSMCMNNVQPNIANVPPSNVVIEVRKHRGWMQPSRGPSEQICLVMARALELDPTVRPTAKEVCYILLPPEDRLRGMQGASKKQGLLAKL